MSRCNNEILNVAANYHIHCLLAKIECSKMYMQMPAPQCNYNIGY